MSQLVKSHEPKSSFTFVQFWNGMKKFFKERGNDI